MYLCICQAVTVSEVRRFAGETGSRDFDAIVDRFSLGDADSCGACLDVLKELLLEDGPAEGAAGCHRPPEGVACRVATAHGRTE